MTDSWLKRGMWSRIKDSAWPFALILMSCSEGPTEPMLQPPPGPALATGGAHTCALPGDGMILCWGAWGGDPQDPGTTTLPEVVPGAPAAITLVSLYAGVSHTCGVTSAGGAVCWGANARGQLGDGTTSRRWTPTPVLSNERFVQLATAGDSTCGLTITGRVLCWGRNEQGQLGRGGYSFGDFDATPGPIAGPYRFVKISGGGSSYCGVTADGSVYCWGGAEGLIGGSHVEGNCAQGYFVAYNSGICARPTRVQDLPVVVDVAVGGTTSCGWTELGQTLCWGVGFFGELGGGPSGPALSVEPIPVSGGHAFLAVSSGGTFSCGLVGARAYCWGSNFLGQLGAGDVGSEGGLGLSPEPRATVGGLDFREVVAGGTHMCGVDVSGRVWCWGNNSSGQLGQPGFGNSGVPLRVEGVSISE